MAKRVFLHIGLPKTATTYLQGILWNHQRQLAEDGLLLPGELRREHLWATRLIRANGPLSGSEYFLETWDRLRAQIADWPGDAILTHEFFAAAKQGQASRAIADLAPARVELIVTAREPLGLFAASWQESLKNRGIRPIEDYARKSPDNAAVVWNWRTLDLTRVLRRWTAQLPPEQVHVLPLPPKGAPRDEIWKRFAGLVGLDPAAYDAQATFANTSMGVAEAETLRRINEHLGSFEKAIERGIYIRTMLADDRLVPRGGDRFWPMDDQIDECRRRGENAVAYVREKGFDVIGDLDDLLVPDELEERRRPDSVTDTEVAEIAVELVASLLEELRDTRQDRRDIQARLDEAEEALAQARDRLDPRPLRRLRRRAGVVKRRLLNQPSTPVHPLLQGPPEAAGDTTD